MRCDVFAQVVSYLSIRECLHIGETSRHMDELVKHDSTFRVFGARIGVEAGGTATVFAHARDGKAEREWLQAVKMRYHATREARRIRALHAIARRRLEVRKQQISTQQTQQLLQRMQLREERRRQKQAAAMEVVEEGEERGSGRVGEAAASHAAPTEPAAAAASSSASCAAPENASRPALPCSSTLR